MIVAGLLRRNARAIPTIPKRSRTFARRTSCTRSCTCKNGCFRFEIAASTMCGQEKTSQVNRQVNKGHKHMSWTEVQLTTPAVLSHTTRSATNSRVSCGLVFLKDVLEFSRRGGGDDGSRIFGNGANLTQYLERFSGKERSQYHADARENMVINRAWLVEKVGHMEELRRRAVRATGYKTVRHDWN